MDVARALGRKNHGNFLISLRRIEAKTGYSFTKAMRTIGMKHGFSKECPYYKLTIEDCNIIKSYLTKPEEKVIKAMDVLNMKNVVIEPRVVDPALTFYGRIAELDMDIYTYDEWFLNDDGEEEALIPPGTVLMGHSTGEGQIEYGLVTQMEDKKFQSYEGRLVPKVWADEKDEVKKVRLTSRPLPRPFDVESWAVIYVNKNAAGN